MTFNFNAANQNKAVLAASGIDGYVLVWGFAPFWIGNDATLESKQATPSGGFNITPRDGAYITGNPANTPYSQQPIVLPWKGSLYILNGDDPGDQVNNLVTVLVMNKC